MRKILVFFAIASLVVIITSLTFFRSGVPVQAQKAFYYPETCLGGWKSAKNASGVPEALEGKVYDITNSAVFKDGDSAIFCGEFKGDLPPQTYHTRVVLRFSWYQEDVEPSTPKKPSLLEAIADVLGKDESRGEDSVVDELSTEEVNEETSISTEDVELNTSTTSVEVVETSATSTEILPDNEVINPEVISDEFTTETVLDEVVEDVEVTESEVDISEPEPEPEPEPGPASESVDGPVSFWQGLFKTVYAEEVSTTTDVTTRLSNTVEENVSSGVEVADVVIVQNEQVLMANEDVDEGHISEAIFSIEYTLDGEVWNNIGYVTTIDNDVRFELPKEVLVTIEDISDVQIALRPLLRFDNRPEIYLDSMWLEISYAPIRELGMHALSSLSPEEFTFDEFLNATGTVTASSTAIGLSAEQFLASTTFIHGFDSRYVLAGVPQREATELWLLDIDQKEITRIGFNEAAIGAYPVGAKEKMIFWLNHDASILFTYDLRTGGSLHEMALVGNLPEVGDKRFTFPFTQWQVVWRSDEFYFFKDTPGEVFKDEEARAAERLIEYLNQIKGEEVVDVEEIDSATSTDMISPPSATTTIDSEIQNENI